jgi:hypothetical protein
MEQMIMSFFSRTFSLAYADPVGSSVAGTLEAVLFDERFEQIKGMVIYLKPVIGDSSGVEGQDLRG